jgi:hypothetical protein
VAVEGAHASPNATHGVSAVVHASDCRFEGNFVQGDENRTGVCVCVCVVQLLSMCASTLTYVCTCVQTV